MQVGKRYFKSSKSVRFVNLICFFHYRIFKKTPPETAEGFLTCEKETFFLFNQFFDFLVGK